MDPTVGKPSHLTSILISFACLPIQFRSSLLDDQCGVEDHPQKCALCSAMQRRIFSLRISPETSIQVSSPSFLGVISNSSGSGARNGIDSAGGVAPHFANRIHYRHGEGA